MNESKLLKIWLLFQKHAFTYLIFILVGILIGVGCTKIVYENEVDKAIMLQRFVRNESIYDISPSAISKPSTPVKATEKK